MTQIIDINNLDIETVSNPLLQAVLICLFTDSKADESELPDYTKGQKCGWWGDNVETVINDKQTRFSWGSKLWMLKRAKMTDDEVKLAELLVNEALSPLITTGFIAENSVSFAKKDNVLTLIIPLEAEQYEIKGISLHV